MGWLGDIFKAALGAVLATVLFAASAAIGNPATFLGVLKTWKSLFVFGSTLLLSAFANRRPNLDLPDTGQSVYGTNEPAKTIYGEVVVGGLIAEITEIQSPSAISGGNNYRNYVCRYALCDRKDGFDYEVVDVEVGGEWLQASPVNLQPATSGIRTLGVNGTGTAFGDNFKLLLPYSESDYVGYLEVVTGTGTATLDVVNTATFENDEELLWTGEGLVWAVVSFTTGAATDKFRDNRVTAQTVRFRVKATPTGKTSSNPADVLKLHLKNEMGLSDARIDDPSFAATALACTARGYSCDGIMRAGQEYSATQWILQTMEGALIQDGGKLYLKGLDNPVATLTITEDMLVEEPEIQHSIAWRERYNHCRAEIIDSDKDWTRQSTAEVKDGGAFFEDGNKKYTLDLGGLNFVNTQAHANKILFEELERRRYGRSVNLTVHHSDVPGLKAYDNVTLNLERNGVTGVWRVLSVIHAIEGSVQLILSSEEWIGVVNTRVMADAVPGTLSGEAIGPSTVRLRWDFHGSEFVQFWEIRYKKSTDSAYSLPWFDPVHGRGYASGLTYIDVTGLDASTTYQFQVRGRIGTAFGTTSNTLSLTTRSAFTAPTVSATEHTNGTVTFRVTPKPDDNVRVQWRYKVNGSSTWIGGLPDGWGFGTNGFGANNDWHNVLASQFTANTTYRIEARLEGEGGETGPVGFTTFTYAVASNPTPPPTLLPGKVRNIQVTRVNPGSFPEQWRFTWEPPNTGGAVDLYWLYDRRRGHEGLSVAGNSDARSVVVTHRNYAMRASNSTGYGPYSYIGEGT